MTDSPFARQPVLVGERVRLRPFTGADTEAMAEILLDPDVRRLTGSVHSTAEARNPRPGDLALDVETVRDWYATRGMQTDRLDLAVEARPATSGARTSPTAQPDAGRSGAVVGEVVLNDWDEASASANFRILLGPDGRDRGLGTEATRLVCAHGFAVGLHRIHLEVFAFNPRARRAYEKVGFVVEGVHRDALRFDDAWVDAVSMAVLAPDWREHHGHPSA